MSHVATAECRITDLDALADACQSLGWELRLGQETFVKYGRPGRCNHVIRIPGYRYEVGLVECQDEHGQYYRVDYDAYRSQANVGIPEPMLIGAGGLAQRYAECALSRTALSQGYAVEREELKGGVVKLSVTRYS